MFYQFYCSINLIYLSVDVFSAFRGISCLPVLILSLLFFSLSYNRKHMETLIPGIKEETA